MPGATIWEDLRLSLRLMRRSPGFTAVAVLALALGIGGNAAIFGVVDAVLLRPLPYHEPDRVVVLLRHGTDPVSAANIVEWRAQATAFQGGLGAAELWSSNLAHADGAERVKGVRVTADLFPLLGVTPALGRLFGPDEEEPGRDRVAVISDGLWRRSFGGEAGVVGRSITLDGQPHTVVGVMPPAFHFPPFWARGAELWAPLPLGSRATSRSESLRAFARLAPGVPLEAARAEMAAITSRLEAEFPGTNKDLQVVPLADRVLGNVRPAIVVLFVAVAFVLLIACANVAHMLLARATARQRETALRKALGATRGRLIRQLLTESTVLAAMGGALGLLFAAVAVRLVVALGPADIPRLDAVALDARMVAVATLLALVTGLGFGIAPAFAATDSSLTEAINAGGGRSGSGGAGHRRAQDLLVGSEFALALVLLVGAGLAIRSFAALRALDPGFDPRGVTTMVVSVTGAQSAEPARRAGFFREVLDRTAALPGVEAASAINHLPLAGDIWGWSYFVEGRPVPERGDRISATYRAVMPGYFDVMRLPILEGRDVTFDDTIDRPGVVLVNETLARRQWPGQSAIGQRMTIDDPTDDPAWLTVIGVVRDAARYEWSAEPADEMYLPLLQQSHYLSGRSAPVSYLTLVARGPGDPEALIAGVRREVAALDRDVAVTEAQTMERVVTAANAEPRFYLAVLAAFAGMALVLASIGIYGVMSYSVSRRTREIGVRITLGASRREVVAMVLRRGMGVALAGAAIGLLAALGLVRLMASMLYGVEPLDVVTFAAVPLLLALVALAANAIPALRAARVDPVEALRRD